MARFDLGTIDSEVLGGQGGSADALFELGMMYSIGRDVDVDLIQAHKWFNLAALRGNQAARTYRTEISQEMTREEIGLAQREAREWLREN